MAIKVSIIIPNRNGEATIGECLKAAFSSNYEEFEVIVVDDFSSDHSLELISQFPCKCLQLKMHSGASRARNIGAQHSSGDILFFTDADCLLNEDDLMIAVETFLSAGSNVVLGGTYTTRPVDDTFFFSRFQSVFIHYSETRNIEEPDYLATHALIISARDFSKSGGFAENFLPILEDVEFSHRMRLMGYRLILNPVIQVRHIFGYGLAESMQNAFRKSMYWTIYSIKNKDLLKDSGTASRGLKLNTVICLMNMLILMLSILSGELQLLFILLLSTSINLALNSGLLAAFYSIGGIGFLASATVYYVLVYPLAVGTGGVVGLLRYPWLVQDMRGAD
jgi:glycosyltransferase involved in cell wall biosynthesis